MQPSLDPDSENLNVRQISSPNASSTGLPKLSLVSIPAVLSPSKSQTMMLAQCLVNSALLLPLCSSLLVRYSGSRSPCKVWGQAAGHSIISCSNENRLHVTVCSGLVEFASF